MKWCFSEEGRRELAALARGSVLFAFDFDGTLAPIARDRDSAEMTDTTRGLLLRLAASNVVAVVSGRAFADVSERLIGVPVKYVVGNHGGEAGNDKAHTYPELDEARLRLEERLRSLPGVDVENKGRSLAVHYRGTGLRRQVHRAVRAAVEGSAGALRLVDGKQVLNVVLARLPHKGTAVLGLLREEGAQKYVYVGDDYTDEDVFSLPADGRGVGIRVGNSRRSAARWFVRDQREVDRLLRYLVDLRRPGTP